MNCTSRETFKPRHARNPILGTLQSAPQVPSWTPRTLKRSGALWSQLELSGVVLTGLEHYGHFGALWITFEYFGSWNWLKLSWAQWSWLEHSGLYNAIVYSILEHWRILNDSIALLKHLAELWNTETLCSTPELPCPTGTALPNLGSSSTTNISGCVRRTLSALSIICVVPKQKMVLCALSSLVFHHGRK